ncbi:hypothetical protein [Terriglobus aquaticus]|uniref:Secreted protein n=1 Tax=Terriglobus aquaticus TaxID=940139 RepID=A0ABW9KJY3_9BACT|nr:hypothetical protein [Terriglobus aquaticus]
MAKRIVAAFILLAVLAASYWAYQRHQLAARLRNGDVTTSEVRDSDGDIAHATPSRSDTPGTINTEPVAAAKTRNASTQSASLSQLQSEATAAIDNVAAPATDTEAPNAPNGARFAGSGRFQIYRQGNLTWRVNTDDGSSCILFATDQEWRKPIVYNHGCPNS